MKPFYLILAAASGCGILVPNSMALSPVEGKIASEPVLEWKAGEYKVVFRLGPKDHGTDGTGEFRSCSHYELRRKLPEHSHAITTGVESAHNNWAFGLKSGVDDCFQIFTSPSGKTLLIAERIPNDCAPCMNWILVTGRNGSLVHEYLELPTRSTDRISFDPEFPTITKVTEKEISFRYTDGHEQTVAVKDVVKKNGRPTFPG